MDRGVALVLVATGRYQEFVPDAVAGAWARIENLDAIYLLSDQPQGHIAGASILPWGRFDWPFSTLLRYRAMTNYAEVLATHELLLHLDVDMRVVRPIRVPPTNGLLATLHPSYATAGREAFTYETNPASSFCVSDAEGEHYFCGAVQGGAAGAYLAAASELADRIESELSAGRIPLWHDESAWNRYCIDHPPEVIWSADYCVPEGEEDHNTRIVALNKDHEYFRSLQPRRRDRWRGARDRFAASVRRRLVQPPRDEWR